MRCPYCTPICIFTMKLAGLGSQNNDKSKTPQWVRDFKLAEWGHQGLFYEYLEMGKYNIQLKQPYINVYLHHKCL